MKRLKILLTTIVPLVTNAKGDEENLIPEGTVAVCSQEQVQNPSVGEYFANLFATANWPARWTCGNWSAVDGWVYIISDLITFAAYFSIPIMLFYYLWKKDLGIFKFLTIAFGIFILSCGITHLIDAIIFWEPIYRFSGFVRAITAVVSVATVGLMIKSIPVVLTFRSPGTLQKEIKKAVAEVDELNKILQESFEIARIGTWELDIDSNDVKWSDSLYDIHEIPRNSVLDFDTIMQMYYGQGDQIQEAMDSAIKENIKFDIDLQITLLSGKRLWIRSIGIPILEDGKVVKVKGYTMDINDSKELEVERQKSQERLEKEVNARTQELKTANQELESFSYYISHDLRAPLRAINGFSEALVEDYKPSLDETASRYLDRISYNSRKMGDLIDDILAFSRMNRKEASFQQVNLHDNISRIIRDLFLDARPYIKVGYLPDIYGDKELIDQLLINLISNAVKYSSKNQEPSIEISGEESDEASLIKVIDNGVGFNMQYANKLFQVFQRLHSEGDFEGTGIGLALCHRIMSAHGGEIWAQSEEGVGSTFFVKFPKKRSE